MCALYEVSVSQGAMAYVCVLRLLEFNQADGIFLEYDIYCRRKDPICFLPFVHTKHQYAKHVSISLTRSVFLAYSFCFSSISYSPWKEHLSSFHIGRMNLRNTTGPYYVFLEKGEKVNL